MRINAKKNIDQSKRTANGLTMKKRKANKHNEERAKETKRTTKTKQPARERGDTELTEEALRLKLLISMVKSITPEEYSETLLYWVKHTQKEEYAEEIKAIKKGEAVNKSSRLAKFVPFIDEDGLVRMRGRLEHASMGYSEKHPIILPGDTALARRLIEEAHRMTLHGQVQACLQYLREKY